jgi:DinB superfamily
MSGIVLSEAVPAVPVDRPGEYAQGLLKRLGDQEPLVVLADLGAAVWRVFDGLPDTAMRQAEAPGKWSMIEVAQHLADSEIVVGFRLRMILAHDRPEITAYDQDLWAERLRYREAELAEVLEQLEALRGANLRLARGLTREELDRVGVHAERGAESVGYLLRLVAGHDLVHLDQLARIRRAVQ